MKTLPQISLLRLSEKRRFFFHLVFWVLLFIARLYLTLITFNVYAGLSLSTLAALNFCSTVLIASVYYLIIEIHRRHLFKTHVVYGLAAILMIIVLYTFLDTLIEQLILNACRDCMTKIKKGQPAYYSLLHAGIINIVLKRLLTLGVPVYLALTLSIPFCIKFALNSWRNSVKALQQKNHNIQLEFDLLKNQVSPHFLFNTLNNIYGLILSKDNTRSADLVARLSSLLRYMLYETTADYMPIEKEVQLLNDYIELEKIRLNETTVKFVANIDMKVYVIPPLLLFPVIENAFKYCPDKRGAFIHFILVIADGQLCLTLENTANSNMDKASPPGIGLQNFKKRLDLCYPDSFKYTFGLDKDIYKIKLDIDIWKRKSVV